MSIFAILLGLFGMGYGYVRLRKKQGDPFTSLVLIGAGIIAWIIGMVALAIMSYRVVE